MLEWDVDAYRRKYMNGIAVFSSDKGNDTFYVDDVSADDDIIFWLTDRKGKAHQKKLSKTFAPVYYPIRSRFYPTEDGYVYLERKHNNNNWLIGANTTNFTITPVEGKGNLREINLLGDVYKPLEKCLESGGPLSTQIFISFMGEVFFRNTLVAERKGDTIVMKKSSAFLRQELKDVFGGMLIK